MQYLWHALQILEPLQFARLPKMGDLARRLADCLGEEHELALLQSAPAAFRQRRARGSNMRLLLRSGLLALLAALTLLRLWLALLGLAQPLGPGWAITALLALLLSGLLWPLQLAVFFAALAVWHWPALLALAVAAPRLILMLPGLISSFLAAKRHPRPRWGPYRPA